MAKPENPAPVSRIDAEILIVQYRADSGETHRKPTIEAPKPITALAPGRSLRTRLALVYGPEAKQSRGEGRKKKN